MPPTCTPHTKISGTWQTLAPKVGCSEWKYTVVPYLSGEGGPMLPRRVPAGLMSNSVYSMVGAAANMWYSGATNLMMLLSVFWRGQVRLSAGQEVRLAGQGVAGCGLRVHLVRGFLLAWQAADDGVVFQLTELLDGDADAWPAGSWARLPA